MEARGDKQPVQEWKPTKQELFIMISLAVIALVVALDATILVAVLPSIAQALNGTSAEAFWAGTSYLLSSAVFQPVIASISEVFGRQQLLLLALFFFTLGTVFCAIANDFTMMLVGRTIQGIGGGGIITMSQVIFCDIVPLRQRPKYFAMVLASWSIGSVVGPVLGGALCENTTWRWVFYINFPFCGLGFILATVFVRLNSSAQMTFVQKIRSIDWIGAMLFLGGTTSFLIGLSWGGIQYPWDSWQTLVPIIVGLANVVIFLGWQYKAAPKSLLPTSLFYCPSAVAAFYCALVNGFAVSRSVKRNKNSITNEIRSSSLPYTTHPSISWPFCPTLPPGPESISSRPSSSCFPAPLSSQHLQRVSDASAGRFGAAGLLAQSALGSLFFSTQTHPRSFGRLRWRCSVSAVAWCLRA
jgi:MFS family permease